jgi:glycosyltransferase involved in cell wall biosynthesis
MLDLAKPPALSVLVPVRDEEPSLAPLLAELAATFAQHQLAGEVLLIDDGSRDGSWQRIVALTAEHPFARGLRLRRQSGKSLALAAGLAQARGGVIVTLDGDGQDDPAEIPRLLAALDEGADVVNGHKSPRVDPWTKRLPSWLFNALVSALSGLRLHDHNCGMKALRREVFDEVVLKGDLHRFLPVLAHHRGFVVRELPVAHRPRAFGNSKYGPRRFVPALLDIVLVRLLTGYEGRAHHVLGSLGGLCALLGVGSLAYLAATWLGFGHGPKGYVPVMQRPLTLYGAAALIVGVQLFSLAYVAALLSLSSRGKPVRAGVRERAGFQTRAG